jgi:hypothetical protein
MVWLPFVAGREGSDNHQQGFGWAMCCWRGAECGGGGGGGGCGWYARLHGTFLVCTMLTIGATLNAKARGSCDAEQNLSLMFKCTMALLGVCQLWRPLHRERERTKYTAVCSLICMLGLWSGVMIALDLLQLAIDLSVSTPSSSSRAGPDPGSHHKDSSAAPETCLTLMQQVLSCMYAVAAGIYTMGFLVCVADSRLVLLTEPQPLLASAGEHPIATYGGTSHPVASYGGGGSRRVVNCAGGLDRACAKQPRGPHATSVPPPPLPTVDPIPQGLALAGPSPAHNSVPKGSALAGQCGPSRHCFLCVRGLSDPVRTLPCEHAFHQHCIDKWMRSVRSCPECTISFPTESRFTDAFREPNRQPDDNVQIHTHAHTHNLAIVIT